MRLLIISYYFPPHNTVGAVRVGKNAKYLAALGHDVRVITAQNPAYETKDVSLPVEIPERHVIRTPWVSLSLPGRIVRHIRNCMKNRRGETGGIPQADYFEEPPPWLKPAYSVYANLTHFPDAFIGWRRPAVHAAMELLTHWRPDLILASALPATAAMAASSVSRRTGVPWACEFRDLWADNYYYPFWPVRRTIDHWLEKKTLAGVRGLVTVSTPLADILRKKYPCPVAVVMNGYDPNDSPHQPAPSTTGPLRILYTGLIYPDKQDPEPLFLALHLLGEQAQHVRLVMYMRSTPDPIQKRAEALRISRLIELHSHVDYAQALRLQREADVLLLLLWKNQAQKGFFTAKIFEYLGARRPVLAVGPDDNVAAALIRQRHAGLAANDPQTIADAIRAWLNQKQAGGIPPLPTDVAKGLTRQEQAQALSQFLASLLVPNQALPTTTTG